MHRKQRCSKQKQERNQDCHDTNHLQRAPLQRSDAGNVPAHFAKESDRGCAAEQMQQTVHQQRRGIQQIGSNFRKDSQHDVTQRVNAHPAETPGRAAGVIQVAEHQQQRNGNQAHNPGALPKINLHTHTSFGEIWENVQPLYTIFHQKRTTFRLIFCKKSQMQ